jgi:ribose/xylose/arabinose/galactoside ABC-type transport system permease subunit
MNRLLLFAVRRLPFLIAGLILVALVLGVPAFHRPRYWLSLAPQYFAPAALALALTPIILTGGIDLSVGSTTVLSSVVIGVLWRDGGLPIGVALLGGVVAGALAGLFNGLLVTAGVLPLVATLATRELYRGLAWTLSGDNPVSDFPPELAAFWGNPLLGLPMSLWALAALWLFCYLIVHHTWAGRMLFAIGDNERAARFAGAPLRGLQLALYTFSGFVAGLCGLGLVLKYGAAKADAERSLELLAIACVVMGGARVTGGSAHLVGTLLGIVTVCSLLAGLSRVGSSWRDTVSGAALIAVALANEAGARWLLARAMPGKPVQQGKES